MYRPGKSRPKHRMSMAYDVLRLPRVPRPLRAVARVLLVLLALPYAIAPFYSFGQPVSTVMIWRRMTGERVERIYVPLSRISPNLARAVIVAEDGRFCSHYGVDFAEIQDAIQEADSLGDLRGGSTITQQVAKNLFLWPGRSYVRKALEFPLALWIDLVLSKRRILEIYLNIAEWGPNGEFGVEAGARRAFGRPAGRLSDVPGCPAGRRAAQPARPQRPPSRPWPAAAGRALCAPRPPRAGGGDRLPAALSALAGPLEGRLGLAFPRPFLYKPGF